MMRSRVGIVTVGFCTFIFASAFVLYFKKGKSRKAKAKIRTGLCPGLINFGNTCFLNSLLQALSPCASLIQCFECLFKNGYDLRHSLGIELFSIFKVLNNKSIECGVEYSPKKVLDTLFLKGWDIPSGEQDAYELFHVMMETINEECLDMPATISLFDGISLQLSKTLPSNEAINKFNTSLPKICSDLPAHPFHGKLANQLVCKRCRHKFPIKYDVFDSLSIPLSSQPFIKASLENLLRSYVASENITDLKCESCHFKTDFLKKMILGKLPSTLCIHIQRTMWTASGPVKRMDHVMFPDYLDMSKYSSIQCCDSKIPSLLADAKDIQKLLGGKMIVNAPMHSKQLTNCFSAISKVQSPYSSPINMLKALNFYHQAFFLGLQTAPSLISTSSSCWEKSPQETDANVLTELESLAHAYHRDTYCISKKGAKMYRLVSVVVHLGGITSGHFITYRRYPSHTGIRFPNRWIYTSDTLVRPASSQEVFSSSAYMLLYEKV